MILEKTSLQSCMLRFFQFFPWIPDHFRSLYSWKRNRLPASAHELPTSAHELPAAAHELPAAANGLRSANYDCQANGKIISGGWTGMEWQTLCNTVKLYLLRKKLMDWNADDADVPTRIKADLKIWHSVSQQLKIRVLWRIVWVNYTIRFQMVHAYGSWLLVPMRRDSWHDCVNYLIVIL